MDKNIAVYGDLTALYSIRSKHRRGINYKELDTILKTKLGIESYTENKWYSIFSEKNDKQVSFVNGLKEIGWNVETVHAKDIRRVKDTREYRFDNRIAVELGLAADQFDEVVVVSDSYELFAPIMRVHEIDPEIKIHVACFMDGLDNRWVKYFRDVQPDNFVQVIDLETVE